MIPAAAVLITAAAAPLLCPSWASLVVSTETISNLSCDYHASSFYVEADYRTWRTVSFLVQHPLFSRRCSVNVNMSIGSGHQLPCRPARLMLMKIESSWLREDIGFSFRAFGSQMPLRIRRNCHCNGGGHCCATYILANNTVELRLFEGYPFLRLHISYKASFVVTEVTNVCDLASNTGQLLVDSNSSSEYAFAPDTSLLPDSVACTRGEEYSLTLRPHVASAYLSVTVLVCPSNVSCGTLLLNGLSCREDETVQGPQPGGSVKLQYTYSSNCSDGLDKYSGFLVSAQVRTSAPPPIPSTSYHLPFSQSNTSVLVTAVVGTLLAAALVISLVLALRARQQLRRAKKGQSCAPTAGSTSADRVSDRAGDDSNPHDGAYESLRPTDCETHVYEVTVLSSIELQ